MDPIKVDIRSTFDAGGTTAATAGVQQLSLAEQRAAENARKWAAEAERQNQGFAEMQRRMQALAQSTGTVSEKTQQLGVSASRSAGSVSVLVRALANGDWTQVANSVGLLSARMSGVSVSSVLFGGALLAAAAGSIKLILAHTELNRELNLSNALFIANGRAADISRQGLAALTVEVSKAGNQNMDSARQTVNAFASSHRISTALAADLAKLTTDYATATGQKPQEAARELSKAFNDLDKGAKSLGEAVKFLSANQLIQIERMVAQGRVVDAQALAFDALKRNISGLTTGSLTPLDNALNNLGKTWDDTWRKFLNSESFQVAASRISRILAGIGKVIEWSDAPPSSFDRDASGRLLSQRVRTDFSDVVGGTAGVPDFVDQQVKDALDAGASYGGAESRIRSARNTRIAISDALRNLALTGDTGSEAYKRLHEQLKGVNEELAKLISQAARSESNDAVRALIGGYQRDISNGPNPVNHPENLRFNDEERRLLDIDRRARESGEKNYNESLTVRALNLAEQRRRAERDARRNTEALAPYLADAERQQKLDDDFAAIRFDADTRSLEMRRAFADEAQKIDAQLSFDRQRILMVDFEQEKVQRQRQFQFLSTSSEERQRLEESYARWVVARHAQITEELKPEWQKMVDAYGDAARSIRDFDERFIQGGLRAGENAFINWARTGKLSIRDLFGTLRDEIARTVYQQSVAKPLAGGLGSLAQLLGAALFGSSRADLVAGTGGVGGTNLSLDTYDPTPVRHRGGVVGEPTEMRYLPRRLFSTARRMHAGGIAGDEERAILRKGEEVLTRSDPRHRYNMGAQPMRVEIVNSGAPKEVQSATPRIDVDGTVVRVVLADMARNGPIAQGLSNTYNLRR